MFELGNELDIFDYKEGVFPPIALRNNYFVTDFMKLSEKAKAFVLSGHTDAQIDMECSMAIQTYDIRGFATKKIQCPKDELLHFVNFFVSYVSHSQSQIIKESFASRPEIETRLRDLSVSMLAMRTFIEAGYGECLEVEVKTIPFLSALDQIDRIETDIFRIQKTEHMDQYLAIQKEVENNLNNLISIDLSDPEIVDGACEIGIGSTKSAQRSLQTVIDFDEFSAPRE